MLGLIFRQIITDRATKVIVFLVFLFSAVWIYLNLFLNPQNSDYNQLFAACYGLIALIGSVTGLLISKKWGGLGSAFGKAIYFFSFGLLLQEFGQLSYSYYIYYEHISVPYPSIGDIGYFGSIIFYILGIRYLAKVSGVRISLKSYMSKLQALFIPTAILALSYIIFLRNYEFDFTQPLKIFLDFGYPLGQATYVSLAILALLLTRQTLGGIMRNRILLILIALCVQYLADYTFLLQSTSGSWSAGGINDLIYMFSYAFMTLGILQINIAANQLAHKPTD